METTNLGRGLTNPDKWIPEDSVWRSTIEDHGISCDGLSVRQIKWLYNTILCLSVTGNDNVVLFQKNGQIGLGTWMAGSSDPLACPEPPPLQNSPERWT